MATYTWSQWRLYGSGWSTTYTASADVSVTRSYGSSTATLSITATMTTQSGDSNTLGWKCWIEVGGTWQSFDIAPSGTHYENTTKTASQTYTVSIGDSAGTLTGGIKFQICGFTGYTGEYSDTQTYSLAYGSKGPTELTSVTNRYYGSAASFTLSRKATNMRENITMVNGNTTLTIRTTSDSATTFTYTLNRSYTPTTAFPSSSTWTITVSTYDGSTLIGTKTYTYSWEIANSDKSSYLPTLSAEPTCQAYNDVVSALGTDTAVAGYSKINVNAAKSNVSLKYNATIASRVVTFSDGTTVSTDTTTHYSGKIMSAGSVTWTYTVTDSRGLSVTRNGSYTVISSNAPVITATVYRGNSSGTAQDGGPYIFVTATALYDSLNGHNSLTLQAKVDSGTYSNITGGTRATLKTNADASTTYTVHVKATDILQSTTNTYKVTASDLPFNVAVGGKGVGIGTKASSDNTLKIGYTTKFLSDAVFSGSNAIRYEGTKATYSMIKFKDNTSDTYGNGIIIGGGGLTIVGGGESADTAAAQFNAGDEVLNLTSDGSVYIRSNLNNGWSSRKDFCFNTSGYIETPLGIDKVYGRYTGSGGVQAPNYFGKNTVGFLMSNVTVNSDSHYKNIMYMDCYSGTDVGGVTALALDRQEARAFIMQSDANRTSWNNTAELITSNDVAESATASKIVKRNSSGYIYATYYNASCSVESSQYSTSSNIMFANSDGWLRKVAFNSAAPITAITSKASNVVIDEGSYARFGRIIVVNMRMHATSNTSTRTYFANLPTPVAPVGVLGISYSTGGSSGTYYYLGTNGSGISNIGSMSTTSHCICFSYIAAS